MMTPIRFRIWSLCAIFLFLLLSAVQAQSNFDYRTTKGNATLLWQVPGSESLGILNGIAAVDDQDKDGVRDIVATASNSTGKKTHFHLLSGRTGNVFRSFTVSGGPYIVGTGDFNKDGKTDVALSAYFPKVSGDPPSAEPGYYKTSVMELQSGREVWKRYSTKQDPGFGSSVSVVKDRNADGIAEVAVSNGPIDNKDVRIYFLSGSDGHTLESFEAPEGASSYFGCGLTTLSVDGDSHPDLIAADILFSPSPFRIESRLTAFAGDDGSPLWSVRKLTDTLFGDHLVPSPDLDGDRVADLIVNAPNQGNLVRGAVHALSGASGKTIWTALGAIPSGQFGRSIVLLKDLNGDAIPEVASGAPAMLPPYLIGGYPGHFAVLSGKDGKVLIRVEEVLAQTLAWSSQFGMYLASPGDLNKNGYADLVVSAPRSGGNADGSGPTYGLIAAFSLNE